MKRWICLLLLLSLPALLACKERHEMKYFYMTATVVDTGEKIEVEVIESPFGMTGPFLVITSPETVYLNAENREIARNEIRVGDKVQITYGGQVMLSYPPQIVAYELRVLL